AAAARRRSGAARGTPRRAGAGWMTSRGTSCSEQRIDAVAEPRPFLHERGEPSPAAGGERVVAAWRAGRRLLPLRFDEALAPEASEQRVERSLGGHQAVHVGQGAHQLESIALPTSHQRQDAELEHPAAKLRRPLLPRRYHATQGTLDVSRRQEADPSG